MKVSLDLCIVVCVGGREEIMHRDRLIILWVILLPLCVMASAAPVVLLSLSMQCQSPTRFLVFELHIIHKLFPAKANIRINSVRVQTNTKERSFHSPGIQLPCCRSSPSFGKNTLCFQLVRGT